MGSWGRNPRSMRYTTYEAAAKHEDSIVPIRGRAVECKPFGDRKYTSLTIRKEEVKVEPNTVLGEGEAREAREAKPDIVVRLHDTDIVRYKPDGRVIISLGGYNTQTTQTAIQEVTGLGVSQYYGYAYVADSSSRQLLVLHNTEDNIFAPIKSPLPLTQHNPPILLFTNPRQTYFHTVNRKAVNAMRKEYASFLTYALTLCRVAAGSNSLGVQRNQWGQAVNSWVYRDVGTFKKILAMALSDDPADNYEAVKYLAKIKPVSAKEEVTYPNGRFGSVSTKEQDLVASVSQGLNFLLIRTYPEEALIKNAVPMGTIKQDEYANWV